MTVHDEDGDVPSQVSGRVVREIPVEDAVSGLFGVARHAVLAAAAGIGAVLQNMPRREHGEPEGGRRGGGAASLWALRQLGGAGLVAAQRTLGYRLINGDGVAPDPVEAFQWLRQGAKGGDAECQYALAVLYADGRGVPEGKLQASVWYHKAADQGYALAQYNLALLYATGDGVNADPEKALYWYRRAAEQNYPRALFNLAVMYESGAGIQPDPDRANELYMKAATLGFVPARFRLGEIYLEGPANSPNFAEAWFWFSLAALGLPPGLDLERAQQGRECAYASMPLAEIEGARKRLREAVAP